MYQLENLGQLELDQLELGPVRTGAVDLDQLGLDQLDLDQLDLGLPQTCHRLATDLPQTCHRLLEIKSPDIPIRLSSSAVLQAYSKVQSSA